MNNALAAGRPAAQQAGFTLVELMLAVVVVAILTGIGYSTYSEMAARSRRVAARALILDVMQHEERFFTENNTYTTSLTAMGYGSTLYSANNSHSIGLAVGATGAITTSVAVTATAVISDPKCTSITLTSANVQSGTGSQSALCWQ